MYYNGARLDGNYPLGIALDGQAVNITLANNADNLDFGLVGCRRSVPHLQRLLGHLEDALKDLERASAFRFRSRTTTGAPRQHVWRLDRCTRRPALAATTTPHAAGQLDHCLSTGAGVYRHSPRHGELEVRPIRHRLPDRVRAQVFLRMLSCYLSWYLKQVLAPMPGSFNWRIVVPPRQSWQAEILVQPTWANQNVKTRFRSGEHQESSGPAHKIEAWRDTATKLEAEHPALTQILRRSESDLGALPA
jgi:hypothetical protein